MLQYSFRNNEKFVVFLEACLVAVLTYSMLSVFVVPGITGYLLTGPTMDEVQESCPGCVAGQQAAQEVGLMTHWIFLVPIIILLVVIVYMKKFSKK